MDRRPKRDPRAAASSHRPGNRIRGTQAGASLSEFAESALRKLIKAGCEEAVLRSMIRSYRGIPTRVSLVEVRRLRTAAEHLTALLDRFLLDTSEGWAMLWGSDPHTRKVLPCVRTLIDYTKELEKQISAFRKRRLSDETAKAVFIGYVEVRSGKPRDAEVAAVLAETLQSSRECTPAGIKMFRLRHRALIAQAREQVLQRASS
jgi:hypothetical protein